MVGVEMADTDEFHVIGIDVDLIQQIGQRLVGRTGNRTWQVSRVPDHDIGTMSDDVAAECERLRRLGIGKGVAEAPRVVGPAAAVEPSERDFLCRRREREQRANAERQPELRLHTVSC
jgi:hypothetical protein